MKPLFVDMFQELIKALPNAVIFAVLASLLLLHRKRSFMPLFSNWAGSFKQKAFRKWFYLFLYAGLLLSVTLFTRDYQPQPFKAVIGKWFLKYRSGFWHHGNIENILLFMPLCPLVLGNFCNGDHAGNCLWKGTLLSVITTLLIEVVQAVLHRGTFQLSDLFFNTVGGMIGLVCFIIWRIVWQRKNTFRK